MIFTRIIIRVSLLLLGVLLATAVHAELPSSLEKEVSKIPDVTNQRQVLIDSLDQALKIGMSGQDLQSLVRLAVVHKYNAANVDAFVRLLTQVRSENLPTAIIRDKILEGMVKKIQADKIMVVSSQWRAALKETEEIVQTMEKRGLNYGKASDRNTLIGLGASMKQRYGVEKALLKFETAASKNGKFKGDAGRLIAAANLTEMLLLHKATTAQAIELPIISLQAGYTEVQIYTQQRSMQDQLRQGVAPVDIISAMRLQTGGKANIPSTPPELSKPSQQSRENLPGGSIIPGSNFPMGPTVPGLSFPVEPTVPGVSFPTGPTVPGVSIPVGPNIPGASFPANGVLK